MNVPTIDQLAADTGGTRNRHGLGARLTAADAVVVARATHRAALAILDQADTDTRYAASRLVEDADDMLVLAEEESSRLGLSEELIARHAAAHPTN